MRAITRGLRDVNWPARLQRLTKGPLAAALPAGWELWLDGAHNASGGEALALMAADWAKASDKLPLYLISGIAQHPRSPRSAAASGALCHSRAYGDRARRPQDAAGRSRRRVGAAGGHHGEAGGRCRAPRSPTSSRHSKTPARVLICGSLYLAGSVLADNG